MKIKLYPYKLGSESARALASALDTVCVKPDGKYKPYPNHIILNWGNSKRPRSWDILKHMRDNGLDKVLNDPLQVNVAVDKLATFITLRDGGVPTPEFTTSYDVAYEWALNNEKVVCRETLTGSRGEGIYIQDGTYSFEGYPLYTKLIPKAREYRVHVFDGEVIDMQQKKRREGSDSDGTIKNLENGWVFTRENMTPPPEDIGSICIRSIKALGLDFGAVDILTKDGQCYVLEVNCAPGLEGSTLSSYVKAIKKYESRR